MKNKRRTSIKEFVDYWNRTEKISEKKYSQQFWTSLLVNVLGIEHPEQFISFEDEVELNNISYIDCFIDKTKVLIEQKSSDKDLDKSIQQSDGSFLTPLEQALRYREYSKYSKSPRWIIVSNFKEFRIYDMEYPKAKPCILLLKNLEKEYKKLEFIVNTEIEHIRKEEEVSKEAGNIVGLLYDAFLEQYVNKSNENSLRSLNKLCVRLVFCLYAEDADIFKEDQFLNYMKQYKTKDLRDALIKLFKVLNTPDRERDPYLNDELKEFPYVNGGLFADDNIEIPQFTEEIRDLLLSKASESFDWSSISPTIFGAVFESTLNQETRRNGGMHYTSVENIHKVINPLFMDDLKNEFENIKNIKTQKTFKNKLLEFQDKLANLNFLDPACGSGNFLTETYLSLRKLENEVIFELYNGQKWFGEIQNPIKISINQFYGIEINDFAVTVAKTALWIAESQMMKKTEDIVHLDLNFLPLETNASIVENNALQINWEDIIPRENLNYIIGNPPFVGKNDQSKKQKEDMYLIFGRNWNGYKELDYVSAWYKKSADFMKNTKIKTALVSTNSITQGQQVPILWEKLINDGININFAYRTFRWDSEANIKAHVHCVIIGFSYSNNEKKIYFDDKVTIAKNINPYLIDTSNIFIKERSKHIQNIQEIKMGSMPNDNKGKLSNYTTEEKNKIIKKYPETEKFFKLFYGAEEFLNGKKNRWCLWLKDINPKEIKAQVIIDAIKSVKEKRESSKRPETKNLALSPHLFGEIRQPETNYLIVPCHTTENRKYIPIAYVDKNIICGNHNTLIADASLYTFGILCSSVHNLWMRTVCGRIKSDFRYSNKVVYNNFPWCSATEEQKAKIEKTAKKILDARATYSDSCLAELYDNDSMLYPELVKAHIENDKAVMNAYGFIRKDKSEFSETEIITKLFEMYQQLTDSN